MLPPLASAQIIASNSEISEPPPFLTSLITNEMIPWVEKSFRVIQVIAPIWLSAVWEIEDPI